MCNRNGAQGCENSNGAYINLDESVAQHVKVIQPPRLGSNLNPGDVRSVAQHATLFHITGSQVSEFSIAIGDKLFFAASCDAFTVDSSNQTAPTALSNFSVATQSARVVLPTLLDTFNGATRTLRACFATSQASALITDFVTLVDRVYIIPAPRLGVSGSPGTIRSVDSSSPDFQISSFSTGDSIYFHNQSCGAVPSFGTPSSTTLVNTTVNTDTQVGVLTLPESPTLRSTGPNSMKTLIACFAGAGSDVTQATNWIQLQDVLQILPDPSTGLQTTWKQGNVLDLSFDTPAANSGQAGDIIVLQQGSCTGVHLVQNQPESRMTSAPIILAQGGIAREFPIAAGKVNELNIGIYKVCFATGSSGGDSQADFSMLSAVLEIEEALDATAPVFSVPQSILLGVDLVATWGASSEMEHRESSAGAWIGLYRKGECNGNNEFGHQCHLAYRALPPRATGGEIRFTQHEYQSAGELELRYFQGDTRNGQGFECKGLIGAPSGVYMQCDLVAAATSEPVSVLAGIQSREDFLPGVPGLEHVVMI